jgi:outer membrane protein
MKLSKYNRYLIVAVAVFLANTFTIAVQAQEYKIGVVNAARILEQSPQAKKTTALIENEFMPRDKQLVSDQKALSTLEERFAKDAAVMNENERRNLERDIVAKRRDLKRSEDEFREDLTFRRNEELAKIQNEIVNAIQIVARDNNFDLVLSEGIIFASAKIDMTDLVIQYLTRQAGN